MERKIRKILGEFLEGIHVDDLAVTDSLTQYGYNSLMAMTVVVALEDEFEIMIEDDWMLMENLNSIEKLVLLVKSHVETSKVD